MYDFSMNADIVKNIWRGAPESHKNEALCWQLNCKSNPTSDGLPYFNFAGQQYKYCFSGDLENDSTLIER